MPSNSKQGSAHLVYGIAFTIIAVAAVIALILTRSSADDSTGSVTISNVDPVINNITVSATEYGSATTTIWLAEGVTPTDLFIHGKVTDENSCQEIDNPSTDADGGNWDFSVYRASVSNTSSCTEDIDSCRRTDMVSTTLGNANSPNAGSDGSNCASAADTEMNYHVKYHMPHYMEPTDADSQFSDTTWAAFAAVTDDSDGDAGTASKAFELGGLLAMELTTGIDFGTMPLASSTGSKGRQTLGIGNTGNRTLDVTKSGGTLSCGAGTISLSRIYFNVTESEFGLATGTARNLGTSESTTISLGLTKRTTSSTSSSTQLYLAIHTPTTGVSGTCTGTITLTSLQDADHAN